MLVNWTLCKQLQLTKQARQIRGLVVGVEAAGVGEDPEQGVADGFRLPTDRSFWLSERGAIGADAQHRKHARLVTQNLRAQTFAAGDDLSPRQFISRWRGARDDVRDAVTALQ